MPVCLVTTNINRQFEDALSLAFTSMLSVNFQFVIRSSWHSFSLDCTVIGLFILLVTFQNHVHTRSSLWVEPINFALSNNHFRSRLPGRAEDGGRSQC